MLVAFKRSITCLMALMTVFAVELGVQAEEAGSREPAVRVAQSGGILKVYSNIKSARVFLNDQEIGKTPTIRLLAPGSYRVKLILPGYETYEEDIEIQANKAVTINAQLNKIVGAIEVMANVDGATVTLDDREIGLTPVGAIEDLPAGTYRLQVQKPGYRTYSGEVGVKANVRLRVKVEMTPTSGILVVATQPEGATVTLDGQRIGVSPLTYPTVEPGRRTVRIENAGFATIYKTVQAVVGERTELSLALSTLGGGLRVRSRIQGASVFLEGNLIGKTPVLLENSIQPGQYSLRVTQDGYADYIQPVVIEPGRTAKVNAEMVARGESSSQSSGADSGDTSASVPLTRKWWFWTAVGGVVLAAAGGTTAAVMAGGDPPLPTGDVVVTLP